MATAFWQEKKEKKIPRTTYNVKVLCHAVVSINDGVDLESFIKNGNDYCIEPTNADGYVIAFKPERVTTLIKGVVADEEPVKSNKQTKCKKEDKLDRYLHFSIRGYKVVVDLEGREAKCDQQPLSDEHQGRDPESKMFLLNCETSN